MRCNAGCQPSSTYAAKHGWGSATGTVTVDSSVTYGGMKSFKFAAAATRPFIGYAFPASQTYAYLSGFFRTDSVAPASDAIIARVDCAVGNNFTLYLKTTGVFEASFLMNAPQTSAALSANTWYAVEMEINVGANPHVVKWRVSTAGSTLVDRTNVSYAVAADAFSTNGALFGEVAAGPTSALNTYWTGIRVEYGTSSQFYSSSAGLLLPIAAHDPMGMSGLVGAG